MSEPQMPPSRMNSPQRLIDAYIDSALDDAGFALLCDWLRADEANRREFTLALALHAGIADWSSHRSGGLLIPELAEMDDASAANDESGWLEVLAALDDEQGQATPIDFTEELARREHEREERLARSLQASAPPVDPGPRVVVIPKLVVFGGLAAALLLAALVVWPLLPGRPATNLADTAEPTSQPVVAPPAEAGPAVGRVIRSVDARWVGPIEPDGKLRTDQLLTLTTGLAELEFNDGARVILQAPATLEPTGANSLRLTTGQLTATIPPSAHGFTVATPSGLITDLGTEFGVRVDGQGATQTHVFQGLVTYASTAVQQEDQELVSLFAGQALTANTDGAMHHGVAENRSFIRPTEFVSLVEHDQSAYGRWLAHSYRLRQDPALMAYFSPDQDAFRTGRLHNLGEIATSQVTLTGPTPGPGRFPNKPALVFDSNQDIAQLNLPHAMDDFTLSAWVWIDAMNQTKVALLCSDDFTLNGSIHWQLDRRDDHGTWGVSLDITDSNLVDGRGNKTRYEGRLTFDDAQRWIHLAVAVDRTASTIRYFVDGSLVQTSDFLSKAPVRLGPAHIGSLQNVTYVPEPRDRHLDGRIDEVSIYNRALDDNEIAEHYSAGLPVPTTEGGS